MNVVTAALSVVQSLYMYMFMWRHDEEDMKGKLSKTLPMKSDIKRPSEKRPVGKLKKVSP